MIFSQNKLLETFTMKNFIDHRKFIVAKMKLNSQQNCHTIPIKFPIMKHWSDHFSRKMKGNTFQSKTNEIRAYSTKTKNSTKLNKELL